MAVTQPIDHASHADGGHADPPRERFLHVVARDSQWVLRAMCLVLLIATAASMMSFLWFLAIPTSIGLGLCYILLLMADGLEHRTSDAPAAGEADEATAAPAVAARSERETPDPDAARDQRRFEAIEKRLTRIGLEVLGGALVLALALGVAFIDWKVLPIVGLVLVVYMILVTTPVWLAWMEDDVDDVMTSTRKPAR